MKYKRVWAFGQEMLNELPPEVIKDGEYWPLGIIKHNGSMYFPFPQREFQKELSLPLGIDTRPASECFAIILAQADFARNLELNKAMREDLQKAYYTWRGALLQEMCKGLWWVEWKEWNDEESGSQNIRLLVCASSGDLAIQLAVENNPPRWLDTPDNFDSPTATPFVPPTKEGVV